MARVCCHGRDRHDWPVNHATRAEWALCCRVRELEDALRWLAGAVDVAMSYVKSDLEAYADSHIQDQMTQALDAAEALLDTGAGEGE